MGQKFWNWFLGLLLSLSFVLSVPAKVSYNVTDLGTLGGDDSIAYGINSLGTVVGEATTSSGDFYACLWNNCQITNLINRPSSVAGAINNSGQVVGFFEKPEENAIRHAFLSEGTTFTDLGTLGGTNSEAHALNDSGQVVGFSQTKNGTEAFLWQNGTMRGLGALGGSVSYAYGINNKGEIVGEASTGSQRHAFVWKNNVMTDLETLGGTWSEAYSINESSQIVGSSELSDGTWHAFFYQNESMQDLGTLGGDISWATNLNNLGQIVGYSDMIAGNDLSDMTDYRACLWENGRIVDLNSLIDENSDWVLYEARDINDLGQIVGLGSINGVSHAFLLSPVPEPGMIALFFCSFLALVSSRCSNKF
jgi:probable HAF family extracellular repeat protein